MNENGGILLEAVIRLDLEGRAVCGVEGSFHRIMLYTGNDPNGHGICEYCRHTIQLIRAGNFVGWVRMTYVIQEWP